jgi:serine/threonine protein phosphatase PrpC
MRLRVGKATHKGLVRDLNEDAYMAREDQGLFVICDGMGGAPDGELASRLAIDTIARELAGGPLTWDRTAHDERGYLPQTSSLAQAIRVSNDVIHRRANLDPARAGMGTTVVGVWLSDHIASVVHVGDSRAYMWHKCSLQPLTRDHTLAEALLAEGLIDSRTSLPAHERNVLVRVVGGEADVDVDLSEVPLEPGDYLLLCSDGLTNMVPEAAVGHAFSRMRDPQQICDCLIDAANSNGGNDNITVVVVQVLAGWGRRLSLFWKQRVAGALHA